MKVLFISSGNSKLGISPIVKNQGESLKSEGIEVEYFRIKGKGFIGYLKAVPVLRKFLRKNNFDVVHAHYSLSALAASLAGAKPMVVSLMGSDLNAKSYYKYLIRFCNRFFWSQIIVKSEDMKRSIGIKNIRVIPNGVNFDIFRPINKNEAIKKNGWSLDKKYVLFAANPNRPVKNFALAESAFNKMADSSLELKYFENVPFQDIVYYHNAASVVLLTSHSEGSPNVIKEAMACNAPIVATNVGDVDEIISKTEGCYLSDFDANDVANKIKLALKFDETNGRKNIKHLESSVIANRIIDIYKTLL